MKKGLSNLCCTSNNESIIFTDNFDQLILWHSFQQIYMMTTLFEDFYAQLINNEVKKVFIEMT